MTTGPVRTLALFNDRGGFDKTSLAHHLAWSFSDAGERVLLVDLDPQSHLTAMCLSEERLEELWLPEDGRRLTMRGAVDPIIRGASDVLLPHVERLGDRLALVPGDIRLADLEQRLSDAWPRTMDRDATAYRITTGFYRATLRAAEEHEASLVLIDLGPNLGAISRAALICAGNVVVPLGADLFSIQGLRNVGPTLKAWRSQWQERADRSPIPNLPLPPGRMKPLGYVVMQPNLYGGQVTKAHQHWLEEIPRVFHQEVLDDATTGGSIHDDPYALAILRQYRSLMPLAQHHRKPIFHLTAADGALGAHWQAVQGARKEYQALSDTLLRQLQSESA